jgi:hypothetical protein
MARVCRETDSKGKTHICPRFINAKARVCELLPKGTELSRKRFNSGMSQTFCPIKGGSGAFVVFDYEVLMRLDPKNRQKWNNLRSLAAIETDEYDD